jgi:hypothetical protein
MSYHRCYYNMKTNSEDTCADASFENYSTFCKKTNCAVVNCQHAECIKIQEYYDKQSDLIKKKTWEEFITSVNKENIKLYWEFGQKISVLIDNIQFNKKYL